MAVGEASRSKGGKKLDDGSSVIDKRCYGRSRKTRVRPASIADEPPPPLPAPSFTGNPTTPQEPTSPATAPASTLVRLESEPPASSLPHPSRPSSSESTPTSDTTRSSSQSSSTTNISQQFGAPPATTPREEMSQSISDKHHRERRGDEVGRRSDGGSKRGTETSHRLSRGNNNQPKNSCSRRGRSSSSRPSRAYSSAAGALSQAPRVEQPRSSAHSGDSYSSSSSSSSGGTSGRTSPGSNATFSEEGESHERSQRRNDRQDGRSSYNKRRSKSRERSSEHDRRQSHRGGETRRRKTRRRREERRSEGRHSKGSRQYDRKRSSDTRKGTSDTRHRSESQLRRRQHHHYRRYSNSRSGSGGSSISSSSSQQYRFRDKRGGSTARDDRTQRGSGQKKRKQKKDRGRPRADNSSGTERRRKRAGTGGEPGGEKYVAFESSKKASSKKVPAKPTKMAGLSRENSKSDALKRKRELQNTTLEAVVDVQRLFRGYIARNRVEGRREALAFLRSACFGVAMDIIDSYIREDIAPRMVYGILANGFEGGRPGPAQRAEAVAAAHALLEETSTSMIHELVTLGLTEEANSHLDAVFVRDRRNPLLVTVDDIIAETLRKWMREVLVEALKEGAEDFMFGRRISELVEDVVEEGMVEAIRPIAAEVYHSANALAAFSEVEEELCAEEAKSVVAETMAPFEDQLVELQREKDVAAIQAAAHHVMIKGLQLQHAARTVGQRGRLVGMSDINGKTLNLLLTGRFLAILRAAEKNRQHVSTSPLLFMLFRRLVVRTGRSVLLAELARELDRDESALHALELERIDELDRHRRRPDRDL